MRGLQKNDCQSSAQSVKITSIEEKALNLECSLFTLQQRVFLSVRRKRSHMQEVLLQQQERGFTDRYH